jgi:hypothetical protein
MSRHVSQQLRVCSDPRRDVIIAAAFGYGPSQLSLFMNTFSAAGLASRAQVMILKATTADVTNNVSGIAAEHGMRVAVADVDYPFQERLRELTIDPNCHALKPWYAELGRYVHYEAALRTLRGCVDRVILMDARDAYFQGNPFAGVVSGFYATQEQVRKGSSCCDLKGNSYNRGWIELLQSGRAEILGPPQTQPSFVDQLERQHGNQPVPILCSGVSMGDMRSVSKYVKLMVQVLTNLTEPPCLRGVRESHPKVCRGLPLRGIDQGVHNWIIWRRMFATEKMTIWSNEDGPVFHNACWDDKIPGLAARPAHQSDPFLQLRNGHRTQIATIVHQYDRCHYLRTKAHMWNIKQGKHSRHTLTG